MQFVYLRLKFKQIPYAVNKNIKQKQNNTTQ